MEPKTCTVCGAEPGNLIELPQDASCEFPGGVRRTVPVGAFVCASHRPISYMVPKPSRVNYGRRRTDRPEGRA